MSKTILITGGAASGKSRWAVSYFAACDYVLYLRTSDAVDADTMHRIEYGNKQNYVEWDIKTNVTSAPASYFTDHKFVILTVWLHTHQIPSRKCAPMLPP